MPFIAVLCASLLMASAVLPAEAAPLASERWNSRILIVFAQKPGSELKQQLDEVLADKKALTERDMLILQVVGEDVSARFGTMRAGFSAEALRKAYGVARAASFTVILVGKDGGEKLRREAPVSAENIFGLIDSMPMRRNEAGN